MRNRTRAKVTLHRETLRQLETGDLLKAAGGGTIAPGDSCPYNTCVITECVSKCASYCCP